ncbi:transcription cofactor vestigial-like protein 2 [Lepisosteus oculatus]|uniref:transcription cofactor vestigial-like protein 2 n=1 Tax=Lepisosteus oculatus TaxID=7918 RepID=UPI0003EA945B|nr:PREDICTED: transcription cofactor vestigial-like protein 1 [Lepisosteus oculatus]
MEEKLSLDPAGKQEEQSNCVLFTYFQGDISSMVDEHFSRALNKANKPKDLSTKSKSKSKAVSAETSFSGQWSFPSPAWPGGAISPNPSRIQFAASENPHPSSGVLSGPHSQTPHIWTFPPKPGSGFGLSPIAYPQPVSQERPRIPTDRQYPTSFLNLLQNEQQGGVSVPISASKPELAPGWSGTPPAAFRETMGAGLGFDSGIPTPEKKDLYWY